MKLQLDENTLSAYINEAIKRELNEGAWTKLGKGGQKAAKGLRGYLQRLGGNKKLVQAGNDAIAKSRGTIQQADDELARLGKKMDGIKNRQAKNVAANNANRAEMDKVASWDTNRHNELLAKERDLGRKGSKLVDQERNVAGSQAKQLATKTDAEKAIKDSERAIDNAKAAARRTQIRTNAVIGAGLAGAGGYALGNRHGKKVGAGSDPNYSGHSDPNAPWNDTPETAGGQSGEETMPGGGFDGTFPWDDTTPAWTPRPARTAPSQQPQAEQPAQPARREFTPIGPVQNPISAPTGVSMTPGTEPGLATRQPQPSIAQQAVHVMGQTANQNDMSLNDRRSTNARTKHNAINAINQAKTDGSMTRQQARNDKNLVRGAEKALRTGQPMSE